MGRYVCICIINTNMSVIPHTCIKYVHMIVYIYIYMYIYIYTLYTYTHVHIDIPNAIICVKGPSYPTPKPYKLPEECLH